MGCCLCAGIARQSLSAATCGEVKTVHVTLGRQSMFFHHQQQERLAMRPIFKHLLVSSTYYSATSSVAEKIIVSAVTLVAAVDACCLMFDSAFDGIARVAPSLMMFVLPLCQG